MAHGHHPLVLRFGRESHSELQAMRPEERRVDLLVTGQWTMRATIAGRHFNARIANLPAVLEVHQARSASSNDLLYKSADVGQVIVIEEPEPHTKAPPPSDDAAVTLKRALMLGALDAVDLEFAPRIAKARAELPSGAPPPPAPRPLPAAQRPSPAAPPPPPPLFRVQDPRAPQPPRPQAAAAEPPEERRGDVERAQRVAILKHIRDALRLVQRLDQCHQQEPHDVVDMCLKLGLSAPRLQTLLRVVRGSAFHAAHLLHTEPDGLTPPARGLAERHSSVGFGAFMPIPLVQGAVAAMRQFAPRSKKQDAVLEVDRSILRATTASRGGPLDADPRFQQEMMASIDDDPAIATATRTRALRDIEAEERAMLQSEMHKAREEARRAAAAPAQQPPQWQPPQQQQRQSSPLPFFQPASAGGSLAPSPQPSRLQSPLAHFASDSDEAPLPPHEETDDEEEGLL